MPGKRYRYSYNEKRFASGGVAALVLGIISGFLFAVLTAAGMKYGGSSGSWIGTMGAVAFLLAFIGMTAGLSSFRELCRSYLVSKIGTLLCGLMVAVWFLIFCVGLAGA